MRFPVSHAKYAKIETAQTVVLGREPSEPNAQRRCAVNHSTEEWRPIVGYEGLYEVSSHGRIFSLAKSVFRKFQMDTEGYLSVNLYRRKKSCRYRVHAIVCNAFFGPLPNGYHRNHIDGVKTNNNVLNLEMIEAGENTKHAWETGLVDNRGEGNGRAILSAAAVIFIRKSSLSRKTLGQRFGVSPSTVKNVQLRKAWKHLL